MVALWLWPAAAPACSVCFSATEENRLAFLLTTIFLTFLPLTLIGAGLWMLRRRALQLGSELAEGS